jgi:enamine deaminase RidA (YjgF/YER057c/UK114 family)
MSRRRSIEISGFGHVNPIPAASRVGNVVASSAISGTDPATGTVPDDLEAQCAHMFANVRRILEAAGAGTEDIVRMTVWVKDLAHREAVNKEWLKMFPDPEARPARHTTAQNLARNMLVQCEFLAVIA